MITQRERAMLNLIAQGCRIKEIAGELYITEKLESQIFEKKTQSKMNSVMDQERFKRPALVTQR